MDKVQRYFKTMSLIPVEPDSISTKDLLEKLERSGYDVTIRTLQRDLNNLSATGLFPFTCTGKEDCNGVEMNRQWFWPKYAKKIQFPLMSPEEALTFKLAENYLEPILPESVKDYLSTYFEMADNAIRLSPLFDYASKVKIIPNTQRLIPAKIDNKIISVVFESILKDKRIAIEYREIKNNAIKNIGKFYTDIDQWFSKEDANDRVDFDEEEINAYELSPNLLNFNGVSFYVSAVVGDVAGEMHTFAVHRFVNAELLEKAACKHIPKIKKDQNVDSKIVELYPLPEYKVPVLKMKVSKELIDRLNTTPLSEDQEITKISEIEYFLTATIVNTRYLHEWLHGFADSIEIIEPKTLRSIFSEKARNLHRIYNVYSKK